MTAITTLKTTIRDENARLDATICQRTGISVSAYKLLRFAFRAVAIAAIVLTAIFPEMTLSSTAYIVLGALALGPDVVEAYVSREQ